jgi:hypothetical protein
VSEGQADGINTVPVSTWDALHHAYERDTDYWRNRAQKAEAEVAQLRERVAELERALSESVATSLWDVPPAPVRSGGPVEEDGDTPEFAPPIRETSPVAMRSFLAALRHVNAPVEVIARVEAGIADLEHEGEQG